MAADTALNADVWPDLSYEAWKDTYATLHLWTQILGKIRLAQTPWLNHSWHVPLYVTARGLGTSLIPYAKQAFELNFDFVEHTLQIETSHVGAGGQGGRAQLPLRAQSVADFYHAVLTQLSELGMPVRIHPVPNEVPDAIPFARDHTHSTYDAAAAQRCWRVLLQADRILKQFRTSFLGKTSPVHFFWGSFDLAVTRFSGKRAPLHPGGVPNLPLAVAREAYSHEVSSAGFWPGGTNLREPVFYSYAYPEPAGFRDVALQPSAAYYQKDLGEFVLPYSAVRSAADPDRMLLDFLQNSYAAAASAAGWDRANLECAIGAAGVPRGVA